ncbi:MAG: 4-hydroxy-3-methylbut-2-enyl diphosphate reductase [Elusimicrobiaceae bacterium]|nr:4-hydroxy-3-methylbut-2-enyl diphosphate reductase [Elusimicrobiaceae bacterium]
MSNNYKITIASSAGFCPGVKNAIERVLQLSEKGKKPVYTVGPLIHNKQVTQMLEKKDIFTINNLNEATDKNGVLVIRAHGITPEFQKQVFDMGLEVVDCTCPLVKRAHTIIDEFAKKGYYTVIIGDAEHAEVVGLLGYTQGRGIVVADAEEAKKLPSYDKVNVVAQTTQKEQTFFEAAEIIKQKSKICQVSNTICNPTKQRQKETLELAKNADLVIVVGGKHSANTARLAKLCGELCKKVSHVETAEEVQKEILEDAKNILITAGASTPDWIIQEVAKKVEIIKGEK